MEFNHFLWSNCKESTSGKEMLHFFENYKEVFINRKNYNYYEKLRSSIAYNDTLEIDFNDYVHEIHDMYKYLTYDENNYQIPIIIQTIDDAEDYLQELFNIEFVDENGNLLENYLSSDDIPFLSEVLFAISPDYFFPYYFQGLYQDIIEIFNNFGIFLPATPSKNDKRGRFFHYFELCKSLYQFRTKNNLSEYELPLFLYGFAINIIKRYKISKDLPKPRKAYFVGGGKKDNTVDSSGDFAYLDKALPESISNWNGNPETQVGDIIVMYCLTPRSYIHSIWRAVTHGSIDPFFHYYKNINIGQPIFVKQISLNEMKHDDILNQFSLIKANMQGVNGRNIPQRYYDRLLELLEIKGQDVSILPKLKNDNIEISMLKNEKDVEKNLLEPLLITIGYKENDWQRQMKLRMGRGYRVYPDYVIFPHKECNNESCYWIWEAKYTIHSHKQLEEDFGQAKSYALRLKSSGLGLVSKEGIWISLPDYNLEKIKFWSWKQLSDRENLNDVFDIAGNKNNIKRDV